MSLLERIDDVIAEHNLLKHPFYEMWSAGELSAKALAGYSKEYFQLVKAVPTFMDAIIAAAPKNSPTTNQELAENRQEEADHIPLWVDFAGELGISEPELVDYTGLSKTRQAVQDLERMMSDAGFNGGAVAMYAFEKEIPTISQTKIEGLSSFYEMTGERATRYFTLHATVDIKHAALWRHIIEDSDEAANPNSADAALLVDTASRSMSAQNLLLDACYEEYCS